MVVISFEIQRTVQRSLSDERIVTNGNCCRDATTWTNSESIRELDHASDAALEVEATINNSAHDLKSPCTALGLGIESLMKNLAHQMDAQHDVFNAQNFEVVKGMYQTLMFMNMTINRSMVSCRCLLLVDLSAMCRNQLSKTIFPNLLFYFFKSRTTQKQLVASIWSLT